MENISKKLKRPSRRDAAYYRQRQKNRVFSALAQFFAEEAAREDITKKDVAEATGKDPSQITRLLNAPGNLELDTISDFLLPFGAEMDHRIVRFSDREKPNFMHPTTVKTLTPDSNLTTTAPTQLAARVVNVVSQPNLKVDTKAKVSAQ